MADKLILTKTEAKNLVKKLQEKYAVIAPVRRGEEVIFRRLESFEEPALNLDYVMSVLPPQKLALFPCRESLFNFSVAPTELTDAKSEPTETVLFGLHVTDLIALNYLDRLMDSPHRDELYWQKREKTIIFGIDYPAHPKAFQPPFSPSARRELYDVFLDDVGEEYEVLIGSAIGEELMRSVPLRRTDKSPEKEPPFTDKLLADTDKLRAAVENSRDSKLWEEMAEKCLACGICTWVCPLCYCFDAQDRLDLNGEGKRERVWDSCLLKNFARIGGDTNFRPELKERFYNWYHHKFVRMVGEYGFVGCTGCGRCTAYCPAGINIKKNLIRLMKEEEERSGKASTDLPAGRQVFYHRLAQMKISQNSNVKC